jgi:DNA helicase-2/ATP-dependent DNA helicase PcrA
LVAAIREAWARDLGFADDGSERGNEARERAAALATLGGIVDDLAAASPDLTRDDLLAALAQRAAAEQAATRAADGDGDGGADGVELATYHRAKGLEWDAVFLPMLEDGSLPIRQAFDDEAALNEERRLLYVGITRARVHLALSWADRRESGSGGGGRGGARRPSRFLEGLVDRGTGSAGRPRGTAPGSSSSASGSASAPSRARGEPDTPAMAALRDWRRQRARDDDVPAFVVAHDTTLRAIADARPATLGALARVKGMGPTKLERYGAEILAAIAAAGDA